MWSWKETYDEGWLRGIVNKPNEFTDYPKARRWTRSWPRKKLTTAPMI
mgnify:CR=1 FL=1